MSKRSYEQYCPLARSLDLVGERWTLLVIRDLIAGPKRYTDLRNGLEGIASDILTQRLRDLETAGLVRRRELPPPAASTVYELTPRGRELEPALLGLARFGLPLLDEVPSADDPPSPERFGLLLRVLFDPTAAPAETETIAIDSDTVRLSVSYGLGGFEVESDRGPDGPPAAATIRADVPTIYELIVGRIAPEAAIAAGRLSIEGDEGALTRLQAAFPAPAQPPSLAA
jgi:DNA-binding HxlR family transcriptional regulator